MNARFFNSLAGSLSASVLFLSGCTTTPEPKEPSQDSARYYGSDQTLNTYAPYLKEVAPFIPTTNVLVLSPRDVLSPEDLEADHDFSVFTGCGSYEDTLETDAANKALEKAGDTISRTLWTLSDGDHPFIPKGTLQSMMRDEFTSYAENIISAAHTAATGREAALYFPQTDQDEDPRNAAILFMPDTPNEAESMAKGLSGIRTPGYLENVDTPFEEITRLTIYHELAGHAAHKHDFESEHYCSTVDHAFLNQSNYMEAQADASAYTVYQEVRGLDLNDPSNPVQIEADLRAIGSFLISPSLIEKDNTENYNGHSTSMYVDLKSPDFMSGFDPEALEFSMYVPLTINKFADAMAGFLYAQDMKKRISENPDQYDDESKAFYNELSDDPADIYQQYEHFSNVGKISRTTYVDSAAEYEYWEAGMYYFLKHGGAKSMSDWQKEQYQPLMEKILHDYWDAINRRGTPLMKSKRAEMESLLKGFDIGALVDTHYHDLFAEDTAEADSAPEAEAFGLKAEP